MDEDSFGTLAAWLSDDFAAAYPIRTVRQSRCPCGGTTFRHMVDARAGVAQRICLVCQTAAFVGDSDEFWSDAEPTEWICACGEREFLSAVGFSFYDDQEIRWITVGVRCVACGATNCPADWSIDYQPSAHLLDLT